MPNNKRVIYVDYLKVIGLFLVILAHVECPSWVMQLRSFDVPLMVFLSSLLASKTYVPGNDLDYYFKRLKRLAVPSWTFLFFFFTVQTLLYKKPRIIDIIKAIAFQKDAYMVGMLWVIWVYLVCALLVPINYRTKPNKHILGTLIGVIITFEVTCSLTGISDNRLFYNTFFTVVPWGIWSYFSFYYEMLSDKKKKTIVVVAFITFLISSTFLSIKNKTFVMSGYYKYPARLYYFCYAIPMVIILFELFKRLALPENKIIDFVSHSSLWIYLWHIFFLYVAKAIIRNDALWLIQYFLILFFSIITTYIQNLIVLYMLKKYRIKVLRIFLG